MGEVEDSGRIGFLDKRDLYSERDGERWSLILFLWVGILWLMRRLSLFENLKRLLLRGKAAPAVFLDVYLLLIWSFSAVVLIFFEPCTPRWMYAGLPDWTVFFCFWVVLQILQTNVYHELWRPARHAMTGKPTDISFSRLRNLVIGVGNYLYVTCLFGMIYWRLGDKFMATVSKNGEGAANAFDSLFDAIYFSFSIAWSCGSLGIAPRDVEPWGKVAVIAQIASTLVLFSILISLSLSAVRSTGEKPRAVANSDALRSGESESTSHGNSNEEGASPIASVKT